MPCLPPSGHAATTSLHLVHVHAIVACLEALFIFFQLGDFAVDLQLLQLIEGTYFLQLGIQGTPEDEVRVFIVSQQGRGLGVGRTNALGLVNCFFERVDSRQQKVVSLEGWLCTGEGDSQFLEVTVGDVVAAPVRDGVELDAVGELHFLLPGDGERTKLALRLSGMVAVLLGLLCYCTLSMEWRTRKRLKLKLGVSILAGHMHNSIGSDLCCSCSGDVSCGRKAWGEGEGVIGRKGEHSPRSAAGVLRRYFGPNLAFVWRTPTSLKSRR